MLKLFLLMFMFAPISWANTPLKKLETFHRGLESRQLLLRHQIKRAIEQIKAAEGHEKEAVYNKNKSFFTYLLSSVNSMNVNNSSKDYIRKGLTDLLKSEVSASRKAKALVPAKKEAKTIEPNKVIESNKVAGRKVTSARAKKFKNAIKIGGHQNLPQKTSRGPERLEAKDFTGLIGWALFAVLLGLWGKRSLSNKDKESDSDNGALQLKMFKDASTPVIFVNENEHIHWANTTAAKNLELTKGSSFYFSQELRADDEGDLGHFQDDNGFRYLVERKTARLNGEKFQMLMFIKTSKVGGAKNYRLTEDSLPIGATLLNSLEKYNYLYGASGIAVSVDQRSEDLVHTEKEEEALDKIVYLAYQMAKDVQGANIKFSVESQKGRKAVQVDIRGLKAENLELGQETFLNQREVGTLGDLWNELEISLSGQDGRVFMFDKSNASAPTLSVIISFASVPETVHSADKTGVLGA